MRIKVLLSLLLVLIFIGCHKSSQKIYKLSDERMAHLMFDLQLAEVTLTDVSAQQQDSLRDMFYNKLETIYHLSKDEIKGEVNKLQSDPEKLKKVTNRVKMMADSIQ